MVIAGIKSQGMLQLQMAASDRATLTFFKACSMSGCQSSCRCLGLPPFVASVSSLKMLATLLMNLM